MNEEAIDRIEQVLRERRAGRDVSGLLRELEPATRAQVETALAAEEALFGAASETGGSTDRVLGPYRLLRLLGRGGQGSIWLAHDTRLHRDVALKLLEHVGPISDERLARFRREAEVTSRLDHPGICPIYEAGRLGSCAWLAMRYVPGATVADVAPPKALDRRLEIVEQAARALHVAHEAGVVHRDVKPANLMLTPEGDVVVLDFGLAGDLESEGATLTRADSSFGTPAYTSPEQVRDGGHSLDRRSDVWSLGVVLHELATGERPFRGATLGALYQSILEDPPRDPRALVPGLPDDLAVVIAKALAKRPEDRYATALELADDLRRVRTHRPIRARRATLRLRLRRWIEREPRLATALAALVVGLIAGLAVTGRLLSRSRRALRTAQATTALAEAQLLSTRDPAAALALALADADAAPRALANDALLKILEGVELERAFDGGGGGVLHCDVAADDERVLASAERGGLRVFSAVTGALVRRFEQAPAGGVPALFTEDGRHVVTGGADGAIRRFALASGDEVANFDAGSSPITGLALRPATGELAVGCEGGEVATFALADGAERMRAVTLGSPVTALAFTADGATLVVATRAGRVLLVDPRSGELTRELFRRGAVAGAELLGIAVAPDGSRVVAACLDNSTWSWTLRGARTHASGVIDHESAVLCVAISPDGEQLATGSTDRTVHVHDHADRVDRSATAAIRALAFSHDGRFLLAASDDGKLRRLRSRRPAELGRYEFGVDGALGATFSPDGERIVAWSHAAGIRLWSAASGRLLKAFDDALAPSGAAAFRRDSRLLAIATRSGSIVLVDPASGDEVATFRIPSGTVTPPIELRFDPSGRRLLVATGDGNAWLLDAHDGCVTRTLRGLPPFHTTGTLSRTAFDRTGRFVATVDSEAAGNLVTIAPTSPATRGDDEPRLLRGDDEPRLLRGAWELIYTLDFAPADARLVIACDDGRARVFDLDAGGEPLVLDCAREPVESALFDASGERIATASSNGTARVFDARTGACLLTLAAHEDLIYSARFSPDGRRLVTAGWDGIAIVWDAQSGERLATQEAHGRPVLSAEFSADGRSILSTGIDGVARRWPADPLAFARALAAAAR